MSEETPPHSSGSDGERLKGLQATSRLLQAASETGVLAAQGEASFASAVAWRVGVVTPGFLGLLLNGDMLARNSALSPFFFARAYEVASIAFLLAILGAVAVHEHLTRRARSFAQESADSRLGALVVAARADGLHPQKADEIVAALNAKAKARLQPIYAEPWFVRTSTMLHPWLTALGYVMLAVILLGHGF